MQDDRLDRRIVIKLLKLVDHRLGGKNYSIEVHYANAVAEAAESSLVAAGVQRQINQRKHRQHKEEECSSADQNPEQGVRTSFRHKKV